MYSLVQFSQAKIWVFILSWRAQGLRRPLPVCVMLVMLLLMRLIGASAVDYDAGAKVEY